ncbi:MAG TPA: hypothetical protein VHL34_25170 [Rhizomicrobium sp.]|jgi:hypothetical protein|nr:hypothetical protein [Rhizomicrobium sp.]
MNMLARAGLLLSVLFASSPALAQHATTSLAPAGFAPEYAPVVVAATSTALTATPVTGTTMLGPFNPQLGRDLRIIIKGTGWAGTITVGTSTKAEACSTLNALTVAGQPWGSYTGNANEVVDTPTLDNIVYCVQAVIASGSPSITVRQ